MSSFTLYLLGTINIGVGIYSLLAAIAYSRYVRRSPMHSAVRDPLPSVALFVPCCGDEEGLEENLRSLVEQDYQPLEMIFIVEDEADTAVPVIRRVMETHDRPSTLVSAGTADRCGQKVHNLRVGIAHAGQADVFAFADSDGMTDGAWLKNLVGALQKPGVGVASSYRFYLPEPGNFLSLLRSAWNAGVLTLLGDHDRNFAWGGAMAIPREVFRKAGVENAWHGALSDDYALTHAVRRAGYQVRFVPESIVVSRGRVGLWELMAWCARQLAITRVYWPNLWRLAGGSQVVFVFFLLGGTGAAASGETAVAAVLILVLLLSWVGGVVRAQAIRHLLPQWNDRLRHYRWTYVLLAPLTSFLTVYAFTASALSRRIHWRGREYEMRSPTETVIIGRVRGL